MTSDLGVAVADAAEERGHAPVAGLFHAGPLLQQEHTGLQPAPG